MPTSDWLIGSYPNLEAQSLTVTVSGNSDPIQIAAGDYYLYDDTSAFDLLNTLTNALSGHTEGPGVSAALREDRRVVITSNPAMAITWPLDGILRDLLGYTGNLASGTSHVAPNISPLFWSGGRPAISVGARLGTDGVPVRDIAVGQSGTGRVVVTSHNRYRRHTLGWRFVTNGRVWTESENNGELVVFFDNVLVERRRFKLWRNVPEDLNGTDTVDVAGDGDGVLPSTGAYVYNGPNEFQYGRELGYHESLHPITIPVVTTAEFE